MNLPNALTLFRILLIPVFVLFLSKSDPLDIPVSERAFIAAAIFAVASFTDWMDGFIARRTGQVTKVGKLLDPVADKILTSTALIMLVAYEQVAPWIAVVLIGREFAVTGLRAIASSEGYVIAAYDGGKIKMMFQILAIFLLLLDLGFRSAAVNINDIGTVALYISMVFSVLSGLQYFVKFWSKVGFNESPEGQKR